MIASPHYNLMVILGPTASGKTKLAAHLALKIQGEVISADSRQVYKEMTLGTGKDLADYSIDGTNIHYHLIDIVEPGYKYNVFEYQADFFRCFEAVQKNGKWPIMCGGTGLYIESVLKQYKLINVPINQPLREQLAGQSIDELTALLATFKKLHNTTDTDTIPRAIRAIEIETYYKNHPEIDLHLPEVNPLIIGVNIDRQARRRKITQRLKDRLKEGLIDEVQNLLNKGLSADDLIYYGLEYKYLTLHLTGQLSYEDMFEQLNTAIHRFAKRQMTWFRGMERKGAKIHWMDAFQPIEERVDNIIHLLNS
jgi:tRNA dimethylallyltransferase